MEPVARSLQGPALTLQAHLDLLQRAPSMPTDLRSADSSAWAPSNAIRQEKVLTSEGEWVPLQRVIKSLDAIRKAVANAKFPAIACSFGKDSLALLELCARFGLRRVVYIEDRDEIVDEEHKQSIIKRYDLEVTQLPSGRAIFYTVHGVPYLIALTCFSPNAFMFVPTNMDPYTGEGPYCCLDERLSAAHGVVPADPVDCLFIGFKTADWVGNTCRIYVDALPSETREAYLARTMPTTAYWKPSPDLALCAPLLDWSHADVWDFLDRNHLKPSSKMYRDDRTKHEYSHPVCYRCHDSNGPQVVQCPQYGPIVNMGSSGTGKLGLCTLQRLNVLSAEEAQMLLED